MEDSDWMVVGRYESVADRKKREKCVLGWIVFDKDGIGRG